MGLDFVLLAGCASLDIVCNPLVHFFPLIEFFSFSDCFVAAKVACCRVVVYLS